MSIQIIKHELNKYLNKVLVIKCHNVLLHCISYYLYIAHIKKSI